MLDLLSQLDFDGSCLTAKLVDMTEENKVKYCIYNAMINNIIYNPLNDALQFADKCFPGLTDKQKLDVLRQYEMWDQFEEECAMEDYCI